MGLFGIEVERKIRYSDIVGWSIMAFTALGVVFRIHVKGVELFGHVEKNTEVSQELMEQSKQLTIMLRDMQDQIRVHDRWIYEHDAYIRGREERDE